MIRLHLVSLISLLLPYGFRTNLVPTERSIQGECNAVGCRTFGEELAEDGGYYREMSRLVQIRDISAFLFWMAARWSPPPTHRVFSLNYRSFLAGFGVFWRLERVFC